MSRESKLLKLFRLLLGDKYKIVPLSDDEKKELNASIADDDLDSINELVSESTSLEYDEGGSEADASTEPDDNDEPLPQVSINYNANHKSQDKPKISAEAQALFERDQKKYGVGVQPEEKRTTPQNTKLIKEAQASYDKIRGYLRELIQNLRVSKKTARETYLDILRSSDRDDPYRAQLASSYNPVYIQEEIDYYKRIESDPFYGMFRLKTNDGAITEIYIGRVAFEGKGITIVSPWSEVGKAFRQNKTSFYAGGSRYEVINKYTYATNNGIITGVKDDSPR